MITVTTIQDRPTTAIPFFIETVPAIASAFTQLVANTSHLIEPPTFELDHYNLHHVSVAKYPSLGDLQAFLAELEAEVPSFFNMRDNYNRVNNISVTRTIVES